MHIGELMALPYGKFLSADLIILVGFLSIKNEENSSLFVTSPIIMN